MKTPMIPKEEIERAAKQGSQKYKEFCFNDKMAELSSRNYEAAFSDGVSFAESKLKEVMREFAEFINRGYETTIYAGDTRWTTILGGKITTEQLITKFLEERK